MTHPTKQQRCECTGPCAASLAINGRVCRAMAGLQETRDDSASVRTGLSDSVPTVDSAHCLDSLARAVFVTSGPHLSGYRLCLGFETLSDVQEAHQVIADIQKAARKV